MSFQLAQALQSGRPSYLCKALEHVLFCPKGQGSEILGSKTSPFIRVLSPNHSLFTTVINSPLLLPTGSMERAAVLSTAICLDYIHLV